jgi:hypothetical protein
MKLKNLAVGLLFLGSLGFSVELHAQEATQEAPKEPTKAEILEQLASKPPTNQLNLSGEALAAKAHLESLLAKRYTHELSTILNEDDFKINFYLDLRKVEIKENTSEPKVNNLPLELQIAIFDPSILINQKLSEEEQQKIKSFLSQYSILRATLSMGVDSKVDQGLLEKAESNLKTRFMTEFGNLGTFQTNQLYSKNKGLTDVISSLQIFLGSLFIALAILIGAMMWKGAQSSKTQAIAQPSDGAQQTSAGNNGANKVESESTNSDSQDLKIEKELNAYIQKISDLSGQFKSSASELIKSWCEKGESGYIKLACFAEAVGKSLGALPIPIEVTKELGEVFAKMPTKSNEDKKNILAEVYWDILTAVNLGTETLNAPFSYLSTSDMDMVQEVLLEENDKLKTLVGIHMPLSLRRTYMATLDLESKTKLLNEAANLGAMPEAEYRKINNEFKAKLSGGSDSDQVAFDMAFVKVVEGISLIEEMKLLPKIEGQGVASFKSQVPSLAFINEWPKDKLALVFSSAMPQEVLAYIQIRPEEKDQVLGFCPEMTAAVVSDELQRSEGLSEDDLLAALGALNEKIVQLVQSGEVKLKTIYDKVEEDELQAA